MFPQLCKEFYDAFNRAVMFSSFAEDNATGFSVFGSYMMYDARRKFQFWSTADERILQIFFVDFHRNKVFQYVFDKTMRKINVRGK